MEEWIPSPGSDEAIKLGCTCPVLDNAFGRGYMENNEGIFLVTMTCPLHGIPPIEETEETWQPTENS